MLPTLKVDVGNSLSAPLSLHQVLLLGKQWAKGADSGSRARRLGFLFWPHVMLADHLATLASSFLIYTIIFLILVLLQELGNLSSEVR